MADFGSIVDAYRWAGHRLSGTESQGPSVSPFNSSSSTSIFPVPGPSDSDMIVHKQTTDVAASQSSPLSMTSPSCSLILSYEDVEDHVNVDIHDDYGVEQSRCRSVPSSPGCERSRPRFLPNKVARTSASIPTRQLVFCENRTDQSRDRKKIKKGRKQYPIQHKDCEDSKNGPMESQKSSIAGPVPLLESCEPLPDVLTIKRNTSHKKHGKVSGGDSDQRKSKGLDNIILEEKHISSGRRKIKRQRISLRKINNHIGIHGSQNSSNDPYLGHGNIDKVEPSPVCEFEATDPCTKVTEHKSKRKLKTSVYFRETVKPLGQRDIANKAWVPPVSVHALIQEELYQDPWKVLVACMLLNKTSGAQMRRVIWDLFALCPTPEAAVAMEIEKIEELIRPLGLQKKRALMIQKFSKEYMGNDWCNVGELHGIGKYATDAYAIFCEGRWREVKPKDHKLVDYWKYMHDTDGLGNAFKDDRQMARDIDGESDDIPPNT